MIGPGHDLGVVLDDDDGVSLIPQGFQDLKEPPAVAGVKAHGGLVEHKEGVDQGRAQGLREAHPFHLAARKGSRLPLEGQVPQAHVDQVVQAFADLRHEKRRGLVQRARCQAVDEARGVLDGHGVELGDVLPADLPEEHLFLEAGPVAGRAAVVAPVAGKKDPHVELVAFRLEPLEESPHAVEAVVALEDEPFLFVGQAPAREP